MGIIEDKLTDAYAVLVIAERYILNEADRKNDTQKVVPDRFTDTVEIKVAERIIAGLE